MKKIAQKAQVREVAFEGPVWVGVDVHKKSYSVAITDKQGVSRVFSIAADDDGLVAKLQQLPNQVACVAYEAGPWYCEHIFYNALHPRDDSRQNALVIWPTHRYKKAFSEFFCTRYT